MASEWETIAVPFQGGIDTKSDKKAAPPTKLVELENGVFTKRGSIKKRHGYDVVDAKDIDGAAVTGEVVAAAGDELVMTTSEKLYSYDTIKSTWMSQGEFTRALVTSKEVDIDTEEQTLGDRADLNGVTVRAWESTRENTIGGSGGVRISITSTATGAQYKYLDVTNGSKPRVVAIGDRIHVVYALTASTDLATIPIDTANPEDTLVTDAVVFVSDLHADGHYDICPQSDGQGALFAYYSTDTETLHYGRLLVGGTTEETGEDSTVTGVIEWVSVAASSSYFAIAYYESTGGEMGVSYFTSPNGALGVRQTDATFSYTPVNGVAFCEGDRRLGIFFEESWGSNPENAQVQLYDRVHGASVYDQNPLIKHSSIASAPFSTDDATYIWVKHESTKGLQNSYFLLKVFDSLTPPTGYGEYQYNVIARAEYQTAAPLDTDVHMPRFDLSADGKFKGILPFQRKLDSQWDDVFNHKGMKEVSVELDTNNYSIEKIGGSSYIPGGLVWNYSGADPVESGFLLFPEPDITFGTTSHTAVTFDTGGTPAVTDATYGYRLYYEWTNSAGERMRSSALSFSVAVSGGPKRVKIAIPTLAHTNKIDRGTTDITDVALVVYRTLGGATDVYYRVSDTDPSNDSAASENPYLFNDVLWSTGDTITFIDNYSDATAKLGEIDALTGGVIDSVAAPACDLMISAKRRLFIAGGEIPSHRVMYSKLREEGAPVEFNDTLYFDLPHIGGAVTGFAELNDNLVVFKRTHIYLVSGDGPSNTNIGYFSEPAQITTDVGCIDSRSIVEIPQGIMFQSEKGIYLLNTNYQIVYIGAEAESFNNQNITSANVLSDDNTVVLLSDDGTTLMYDHFHSQWGTFNPHQGRSATIWDGKYCYMRSDSTVYIENEDRYKDGNVAYKMRLKTAPLRMGGLQEYWRCKRVYVLGEYYSSHKLRMHVWYNRNSASNESVTWDPADFITDEAWGDNPTWGGGEKWGGELDSFDYQVSYAPARQKVQSISLEFEEVPTDTPDKSFELTELALMWAPKTGLGRLAASRRK